MTRLRWHLRVTTQALVGTARFCGKVLRHLWRLLTGRAALHVVDAETGATRFAFDARRTK